LNNIASGESQHAAAVRDEAAVADPQQQQSRSQQSQQWSASVRELAEDMPDPQEDELVDVGEGAQTPRTLAPASGLAPIAIVPGPAVRMRVDVLAFAKCAEPWPLQLSGL